MASTRPEGGAAAGFGAPRPGLLVGLTDPATWATPFARRLGEGALVEVGRLACGLDAAARLAERAWNLGELAGVMEADLRRTRETLRGARATPPAGAEVVRLLFDAFGRGAAVRLAAPALPAELLPPRWPETDLHRTTTDLAALLYPAMYAYAERVIAASPHHALYVPDPSWSAS